MDTSYNNPYIRCTGPGIPILPRIVGCFIQLLTPMNGYSDYTDTELVVLLGQDNPEAFEVLYHRYALSLYRYAATRICPSETAEELVQDVFLWLWERRDSLAHVTQLKAYLYTAIRNKIIDHIAHSTLHERYAASFRLFETGHRNSTEELLQLAELQDVIEQNLATLPENYQTAFRLSRFEHLSIADIAARMNLSTGTVENYITFALKHLRGVLGR